MAEVLLFPLAGKILSTLSPLIIDQIGLPWYAKKELTKLENKISTIRNVLLHAQEVQESNDTVKDWLRRLKIILYDADDLFDEVATEALRQEIVINKSTTNTVQRFFTRLLFHHSLGQKIQDISERLDEICTDMRNFNLLVRTLDKPIIKRNENDTDIRETTALIPQNIIGREDDKKKLLQLLLSSLNDKNVHVIPVVGMGGLGKTTLAQMIFNDNTLNNHFDKKLWVCVSDDFNVKRILTNIITAAGGKVMNTVMEELNNLFQENLSGKKFFLVLDDVWNDDLVKWKNLADFLMTGAPGSRILVTTRDKIVAKIVHTMEPYELKGLSEKECLSILVKWAFENGKEANHPDLVEIGRQIVKKCGGVPLAARTLGVLLNSKISRKEWLLVRDSEMWAQVQNKNDVLPILKLSYDQMPSSLKECFGYCSLFQKDETFSKEKLMYHWIAHGFVQSSNTNDELEDVCETYLQELLRRSFLECVKHYEAYKNNDMVFYKMHDLVHDLATYVAGDEILIPKEENVSVASPIVRHVSLYDSPIFSKSLLEGKNLRTIMRGSEIHLFDEQEVLHLHSRRLRVLDHVTAHELGDVTKSIKKLKYLRYLNIHGVKTIPESLCELLNLQYLELHLLFPDTIPDSFGNLRNLRVLIIESPKLICLPEGIRSLTSLRILKIHYCYKLRSLGTGLGCITSLENLEINSCFGLQFSNTDFQGLTNLKYLFLYWLELQQLPTGLQDAAATLKHLKIQSCLNLTLTEEVLPNLSSLEVLEIGNCPTITRLPEGIQSLTSFHTLKIYRCVMLRSLGNGLGCITSLEYLDLCECLSLEFSNSDFQGLTSLKYLSLSFLKGLKQLPTGLQDSAATIKHLKLSNCHNLKLTEEVLPNLSSLEALQINSCSMITYLPEGMQSLGKLNLLEIDNNTSLGERCKPSGGDWPKISHVPRILVGGIDVRSP